MTSVVPRRPRPPWHAHPELPSPELADEVYVGTVNVQPSTGLTVVQGRHVVRACHIEYTVEEWEAVLAGRWHEAIDKYSRMAYRCSVDVARREGASLRRAGVEVRWLYVGVMQAHRLRRLQ